MKDFLIVKPEGAKLNTGILHDAYEMYGFGGAVAIARGDHISLYRNIKDRASFVDGYWRMSKQGKAASLFYFPCRKLPFESIQPHSIRNLAFATTTDKGITSEAVANRLRLLSGVRNIDTLLDSDEFREFYIGTYSDETTFVMKKDGTFISLSTFKTGSSAYTDANGVLFTCDIDKREPVQSSVALIDPGKVSVPITSIKKTCKFCAASLIYSYENEEGVCVTCRRRIIGSDSPISCRYQPTTVTTPNKIRKAIFYYGEGL